MVALKSLRQSRDGAVISADLGCSSDYSMERVDFEDRRGEGFRVDRKGTWPRRISINHG